MSKEALPDHLLTEAARRARRSDRCRAEYGIGFDEFAALICIIARWRCFQMTTTRADIRAFLEAEEGMSDVPGFMVLERKRLARRVSEYSHQAEWAPTALALQKFSWVATSDELKAARAGRGEQQGAAE